MVDLEQMIRYLEWYTVCSYYYWLAVGDVCMDGYAPRVWLIRLLGEGLRDKRRQSDEDEGVWDRILKELASIREHEEVAAVDSSTVKAKKRGER